MDGGHGWRANGSGQSLDHEATEEHYLLLPRLRRICMCKFKNWRDRYESVPIVSWQFVCTKKEAKQHSSETCND